MPRWVDFIYRDFVDVPRAIVVQREDDLVLLDCRFDDDTDDYPDTYQVYLLPLLDLPHDWSHLSRLATAHLGSIPVTQLQLDETRRAHLDLDCLMELPPR